ncbi:hypothetical protein [Breoghania sp.]|uniref:hypothetical protein n=1 Tax=Breoghania sp. TaxID=2065378 RepID=UPI002AAB51D7|nr:hypothetical protein [Breoghania sp.]
MQDEQNERQGQGRAGDEDGSAACAAALRQRILRRLTGREPEEGEAGRKALVARLARALRGERRRGRAGHWSYDLNRHIALLQAYRAECDGLRALRGTTRPSKAGDHSPSDPRPGSLRATPTRTGKDNAREEGPT